MGLNLKTSVAWKGRRDVILGGIAQRKLDLVTECDLGVVSGSGWVSLKISLIK